MRRFCWVGVWCQVHSGRHLFFEIRMEKIQVDNKVYQVYRNLQQTHMDMIAMICIIATSNSVKFREYLIKNAVRSEVSLFSFFFPIYLLSLYRVDC